MQSHSRMMIVGLVVVAGVLAAGSVFALSGAGSRGALGLARPQCDGPGQYMPVIPDGLTSMVGLASASGGVARVTATEGGASFFDVGLSRRHHRHPPHHYPRHPSRFKHYLSKV
jgi:hypothetical protein